MSLLDKAKNVIKSSTATSQDEEIAYEIASQEVKSGDISNGLMAKAFSQSDGDQNRANAKYLELRATQILRELPDLLKNFKQIQSEKIHHKMLVNQNKEGLKLIQAKLIGETKRLELAKDEFDSFKKQIDEKYGKEVDLQKEAQESKAIYTKYIFEKDDNNHLKGVLIFTIFLFGIWIYLISDGQISSGSIKYFYATVWTIPLIGFFLYKRIKALNNFVKTDNNKFLIERHPLTSKNLIFRKRELKLHKNYDDYKAGFSIDKSTPISYFINCPNCEAKLIPNHDELINDSVLCEKCNSSFGIKGL